MAKKLSIIALVLLVSACKPVSKQDQAVTDKIPAQCINSQSACEINTEFARFSVKFSQAKLSDNIKTELPFFVELTELFQPQEKIRPSLTKVTAYLEGRDMFMGKVPVFFEINDNGSSYSAQSLLANCSEEKMVWRLWITAEKAEQTQTFFVDFTSQRL